MTALWGGRFAKDTDEKVAAYTASVRYDARLYPHDIEASKVHARMLAKTGIIPQEDAASIVEELERIRARLDAGDFELRDDLEDIHMNVESALIDALGDVGARVHSGRSRNDQIATDERLCLREETDHIVTACSELQKGLLVLAEKDPDAVLPGFTHLQHAQPVLFAHHLLAYVEMLERDKERLLDGRRRINRLPLGAGALAGSTLPLDRDYVARELGFDTVLRNSMDAVGDRDYIIEMLSTLSIVAMHCSRLAEDVILWSSQEFSFIELDDAFCTGSSLMPQKKNPDVAELTRGKTGRVYASLMGMLTVMKGLPLTYNRDLQEDKEGLFDAVDTVRMMLLTMAPMLAAARPCTARMEEAAGDAELMATDLAEWLVKKGVPFREAHRQVGRYVAQCRARGVRLDEASLADMQACLPKAERECLELFSAHASVRARQLTGGTAPERVREQMDYWHDKLAT